jgi:hypothetical protein
MSFPRIASGASFASLTGVPADNAALVTALGLKLNLTGGTLTGPLTITGGTVTTSTPLLIQSQTWNDGTVAFKVNTINVVNTASKAYSDTTWANVSTSWEIQDSGVAKLALIPKGSENSAMLRLGGSDVNHALLKDAQTAGGIIFRGSGGLVDFACVGRMGDGSTGVTVANYNGLGRIGFNSTSNVMAGGNSAADAFFQRGGAAHIKMGVLHAATAINQKLSAHNVTNGVAAKFTLAGGDAATGTGGAVELLGGAGSSAEGAVRVCSSTGALGFFGGAGSVKSTGNTTHGIASSGSGSSVHHDTTFDGGSGNAYTIGGIVAALKSYGLLG